MEDHGNILLQETFRPLPKENNISYNLKVTTKGIIINWENGSIRKTEIIGLNDIVGCRCTRKKRRENYNCVCNPKMITTTSNDIENVYAEDPNDTSAYLHIYSYVIKEKFRSGQKRERFTITLRFKSSANHVENMQEAQMWKVKLRQLINDRNSMGSPLPPLTKRRSCSESSNEQNVNKFLVVLNPKSGVGKSREIFQQNVVPVLIEADAEYDLHVTKERNDARNLMRTSNVFQWRQGIIVIGGDGVLFEVINGIMERPDWKEVFEVISFGIIPGGSGNGLAKSLNEYAGEPYDDNPVLVSVLSILKGKPASVDLVRIESQSEIVFSFLSFGWGLLADIDIESERLRLIGGSRFTIWGLVRLTCLRTYPGRLSFLRIPQENVNAAVSNSKHLDITLNEFMETSEYKSNCSFDMESISLDAGSKQADVAGQRERFCSVDSDKSDFESADEQSTYGSLPELNNKNNLLYGPVSQLPHLNHTVPSNWEVYEGEFVLVHAAYQSHLGEDVIFAPNSKPHDGIIWLIIIRAGISRTQLFQFLLALSSGTHGNVPNVEIVPVFAFRLEPFTCQSNIVVDGEVIEHGVVQAEVLPSPISVFVRGQKIIKHE